MTIDSRAVIDPAAELDSTVQVGPFAVIGPGVQIGPGSSVGAHAVIEGTTVIGADNRIFSFASIGTEPQDKKYQGEATRLEIGNGNTIREYVSINRGTGHGGGVTKIEDDNWIMATVHIAHDCQIGSHTIFANGASLAGHISVGDYAIVSGFALIHQFCRIGAHALVSFGTRINRDVPPYVIVANPMAQPKGINTEGLRRRGFSADAIAELRRAYKLLYKSGLQFEEAKKEIGRLAERTPELELLTEFLAHDGRGLLR